ncbi:MAG: helix-turn-helix domain-containing protein [Clostridia bacterium]|nr:helix-turn-helix domain-containing protein [Clostridia bacterium]
MERSFPVILSELRKEKGMSQKEAAHQLGISQALLSHYEKGIRECGQSFLIKAAEFYDVSCDYLLGRTVEKNSINTAAVEMFESEDSDSKPTPQTLVKASMLLTQEMRKGNKMEGVDLNILFSVALYKIILLQANAGNLPKNWAGRAYIDGKICCNPTYLGGIEFVAYNAIKPLINPNPEKDAPIPDAVKTLVSFAENFILKNLAESTPPMPPEFFR